MPGRLLLALAAILAAAAPALCPAGTGVNSTGIPHVARPGSAGDRPLAPALPSSLFAPLERPGPTFSVPADALAASLTCAPTPSGAPPRDPVLLLSGTGVDSAVSFDWNYEPALSAAGITSCASDAAGEVTGANNGDIQTRAEYVVYAVRELRARTGRLVDVIGHGQGALAARVALRFWPDIRDDVSDLIALAPPNQGSTAFDTACAQACPPAYWQQRPRSMLISAVNLGQATFPGVDYTVVMSTIDDVVTPQPAARCWVLAEGCLTGGSR